MGLAVSSDSLYLFTVISLTIAILAILTSRYQHPFCPLDFDPDHDCLPPCVMTNIAKKLQNVMKKGYG